MNQLFLQGTWEQKGVFLSLESLDTMPIRFRMNFGLADLPKEPGLIAIRGARQYGKSTWLEQQMKNTLENFGPASCFYLNGDDILDAEKLFVDVVELTRLFPATAKIKRIFIDEITAVQEWQRAMKRLFDQGFTRDILLVTTGSKASDLRHSTERLPGRRGKLHRYDYIFTPISYPEFEHHCANHFGQDTLIAYLLSGGSPLAANELVQAKAFPKYLMTLTKDWILGECAASRRSRNHMIWLLQALVDRGGSPVSLAKLAREINLANNTVAQGYLELLADLLCVADSIPTDPSKPRGIPRKEHKYPFTNLLVAHAFDQSGPHTIETWKSLPTTTQAKWLEWLVAQELWRRAAIDGSVSPETMFHFQTADHEVDFRVTPNHWLEVKRGKVAALEFSWFSKIFPKHSLTVINPERFESQQVRGITMEDFLHAGP